MKKILAIFVVLLLMIVASVLMYSIENSAQPDVFKNAFDALWWALATLTTVGYGDAHGVEFFICRVIWRHGGLAPRSSP